MPVWVLLPAKSAFASIAYADLGYPHVSMPCSHRPYAVNGNCDNYDWGPQKDSGHNWGVNSTYSSRSYGYRNCTDYAAWRLQSLGVADNNTRGLGHAAKWADNARKKGLSWSHSPKAGSVAVAGGGYGHVAFVEAVNPDGTISVSEYNRDGKGRGSTWTGYASTRGFNKFIDFGVKLDPPKVEQAESSAHEAPKSESQEHEQAESVSENQTTAPSQAAEVPESENQTESTAPEEPGQVDAAVTPEYETPEEPVYPEYPSWGK